MLTFQEIISSSPFYDAEIIGGWKGKERAFIKAEENLINLNSPTLLVLQNSTHTIMQMTEFLSAPNVQGIILFGSDEMKIPSKVIDLIENFGKPVLLLEKCSYFQIKNQIEELYQLKRQGLYHYVWERSANYWQQLINEHGLNELLTRLRLFIDPSLILMNAHFQALPQNIKHEIGYDKDKLKSYFYDQLKNNNEQISIMDCGDQTFIVFQLLSGKDHLGAIFLQERPGLMIDVCIEQITYAIPAIISFLKKEEAVFHAHQTYKDHFLQNLLYNGVESEEGLILQGKQWGWDFSKPAQLMVLRLNPKDEVTKSVETDDLIKKIRSLIAVHFLQAIIFPIEGNITMIIFESLNETRSKRKAFMLALAQKIVKEMNRFLPDLECQIGLGRQYPSNTKLFRSFFEARMALELSLSQFNSSGVIDYEDLSLVRLIGNIDKEILNTFCDEILGKIIDLDIDHDDYFFETLVAFFHHNGDINETAKQLFIHPNTLRKRLKKIEAILQVDFNQLDDLLKIYVALKIKKMIK